MVLYVRIGDLIRDFGHTYSAKLKRAFKIPGKEAAA
jgi:hypothetical protein